MIVSEYASHEKIMKHFVDSVQKLLDDIKVKQNSLEYIASM